MKTALIFGRAKGVWEEVAAAKKLCKFTYTLAVGPVAIDYPGEIDAWVWFHTELFEDCALRRAKKGHPPARSYWSCQRQGVVTPYHAGAPTVQTVKWNEGGSSGLVAIVVAQRALKVDRTVLAGIPMTAEGGQYDTPKSWVEAEKHRRPWEQNLPMLADSVRSMSGWTQELLGAPTKQWLRK
jgi:hypothetical protein